MLNILVRNLKWILQNPIAIGLTIIQPLIWLVLYGTVAGQSLNQSAGGNYTAFVLPGILVLVIFSSSGHCGILNYLMKTGGSFYRIRIAPVSRSAIVLGNMLANVLLSFIEITILVGLSLCFSVRIATGFAGVLLMVPLLFLTAFFMAGLSYTLSLSLPNEVVFETMMNTIVLPVFFVSTALFPLDRLTGGLRTAVLANPFSHIINSLRKLVLDPAIDWRNLLWAAALFAILGSLSYLLALWRLKNEV